MNRSRKTLVIALATLAGLLTFAAPALADGRASGTPSPAGYTAAECQEQTVEGTVGPHDYTFSIYRCGDAPEVVRLWAYVNVPRQDTLSACFRIDGAQAGCDEMTSAGFGAYVEVTENVGTTPVSGNATLEITTADGQRHTAETPQTQPV